MQRGNSRIAEDAERSKLLQIYPAECSVADVPQLMGPKPGTGIAALRAQDRDPRATPDSQAQNLAHTPMTIQAAWRQIRDVSISSSEQVHIRRNVCAPRAPQSHRERLHWYTRLIHSSTHNRPVRRRAHTGSLAVTCTHEACHEDATHRGGTATDLQPLMCELERPTHLDVLKVQAQHIQRMTRRPATTESRYKPRALCTTSLSKSSNRKTSKFKQTDMERHICVPLPSTPRSVRRSRMHFLETHHSAEANTCQLYTR